MLHWTWQCCYSGPFRNSTQTQKYNAEIGGAVTLVRLCQGGHRHVKYNAGLSGAVTLAPLRKGGHRKYNAGLGSAVTLAAFGTRKTQTQKVQC